MLQAKKAYYLAGGFLIILNILFLILWIKAERFSRVQDFVNKYPLVDPARSYLDQRDFVVNLQPLREDLKSLVASSTPNEVGVYFEVLNTGANIAINQDVRFWPASLGKVPVALVAMKKIEKGEWKLTNELIMFSEDQDERFGELYKQPVGTRFTIEALLKEMLINSDNTAQKILIRNLPSPEFDELLAGLGLEELFDQNYDITAKEYSRIFRALFVSSYLEPQYSQMILNWLSESEFDKLLAGSIPQDVPFAHKIGQQDIENVFLDAGIVYAQNRPYMITVMIKINDGSGEKTASELMKQISQKAYNYVQNY